MEPQDYCHPPTPPLGCGAGSQLPKWQEKTALLFSSLSEQGRATGNCPLPQVQDLGQLIIRYDHCILNLFYFVYVISTPPFLLGLKLDDRE